MIFDSGFTETRSGQVRSEGGRLGQRLRPPALLPRLRRVRRLDEAQLGANLNPQFCYFYFCFSIF